MDKMIETFKTGKASEIAKKKREIPHIVPGTPTLTMVLGVFNRKSILSVKTKEKQITAFMNKSTTGELLKVLREFFLNTKRGIEFK